jgi:hypothetical protein
MRGDSSLTSIVFYTSLFSPKSRHTLLAVHNRLSLDRHRTIPASVLMMKTTGRLHLAKLIYEMASLPMPSQWINIHLCQYGYVQAESIGVAHEL